MPNKKFQVTWSKSAAFDLRSIIMFIAKDSPQNARDVLTKIKHECKMLESFPDLGKLPIELEALQIGGYRELSILPWRVFYKKLLNQVFIVAVADSRRDLEEALWNRLMR